MKGRVNAKPILFSGPMVRAILEGQKTQTRRVVKNCEDAHGVDRVLDNSGFFWRFWWTDEVATSWSDEDCPYGETGSLLWVRETWATANSDNGPCICYKADHNRHYLVDDACPVEYERYPNAGQDAWCNWASDLEAGAEGRWKPSIHMPRWASRITLEVTGVRVERLQEISGDDLSAEGFPPDNSPPHDGVRLTEHGRRMCFSELWDQINDKRGFGWSVNPFVWVVEFIARKP